MLYVNVVRFNVFKSLLRYIILYFILITHYYLDLFWAFIIYQREECDFWHPVHMWIFYLVDSLVSSACHTLFYPAKLFLFCHMYSIHTCYILYICLYICTTRGWTDRYVWEVVQQGVDEFRFAVYQFLHDYEDTLSID